MQLTQGNMQDMDPRSLSSLILVAEHQSRHSMVDAIRMRLEQHALETVDAVDEITRKLGTK